jgi:hypothetical protein|tara:strand:+ start:1109 stop:1294 length:186 start_codon:yes stop_codon:yes gene_type:complete
LKEEKQDVFKISTTNFTQTQNNKKERRRKFKEFASVTLFLPSAGKKTRAREQTTASTTIAR